jgi:hypothetical protein
LLDVDAQEHVCLEECESRVKSAPNFLHSAGGGRSDPAGVRTFRSGPRYGDLGLEGSRLNLTVALLGMAASVVSDEALATLSPVNSDGGLSRESWSPAM